VTQSQASLATCPVCASTSTYVYFDLEEDSFDASAIGSSRDRVSPGRILRCRTCRFAFRQLRSSPEQLHELYRQMDPKVYDSELEGRNRTARKHLQIVQRFLRSGRMLDVGCASGLFLSHALSAGWDVTGIEPNEKLCEQARSSIDGRGNVQCATLETAQLDQSFDVITLWDVLEHVPDPRGFLQLCCGLLRPGGFAFLNVPDLDSPEARLLGRRWPLLLPEHLNYFNRQSLQICANRAELTPVEFGRRRAWFSGKYVAYRVAQHQIPASRLLQKAAETSLGRVLIPIALGETFGVLRATSRP